jgi:hypothetical protein
MSEEVTGSRRIGNNKGINNFYCLSNTYYYSDKMKENETKWACSTHEADKMCAVYLTFLGKPET